MLLMMVLVILLCIQSTRVFSTLSSGSESNYKSQTKTQINFGLQVKNHLHRHHITARSFRSRYQCLRSYYIGTAPKRGQRIFIHLCVPVSTPQIRMEILLYYQQHCVFKHSRIFISRMLKSMQSDSILCSPLFEGGVGGKEIHQTPPARAGRPKGA